MANLNNLVDAFTGPTLDPRIWTLAADGQASIDTVNDQVLLDIPTAANASNGIAAHGPYDATGSSVYAQVTPAPGAGTYAAMTLDAGQGTSVTVRASAAGAFVLRVQQSGTYDPDTVLPTYDPHAHRWWRLTETDGTLVAAASPDGYNWTDLATVAHTGAYTACSVVFQAGTTSTQTAGLVAAVAHVNTVSGGRHNPAWPLMRDEWGPRWDANRGRVPQDSYVDVTPRTWQTVSVMRGRQYELDQMQASEASLALRNLDGTLTPENGSGPWTGRIRPFQPYRKRAQWPPTINLLPQTHATAGQLGGEPLGVIDTSVDGPGILSQVDASGGRFATSPTAWRGTTVMQFDVPTETLDQMVCYTPQLSVEPDGTYTHTVWVRDTTLDTEAALKAEMWWLDSGLNQIHAVQSDTVNSMGSPTAGWKTLTVTGTAPPSAAVMCVGVRYVTAFMPQAEGLTIEVGGWQVEEGATASPWVCPGQWHPVFAGFIERWPQQWSMSGTFGVVQPTAVDALALLSQVELDDPLTEEMNAAGSPRFLFKLDDPSTSIAAADATGNHPAASIAGSKYGSGSLTFGNEVTAADPVNGVFTGSGGTVVTINNANPGMNLASAATFLNLASAGITGPTDPGRWTRVIAFRYTGPTPASYAYIWSAMDTQRGDNAPSGSRIYLRLDSTGRPYFYMTGPTGEVLADFYTGFTNCADGNWHLVTIGFDYDARTCRVSTDGFAFDGGNTAPATKPTGIVGDNLGAFVDITVGNGTSWNFQGDISFAGEWPTLLSTTQLQNLYAAWKNSCAGESTDARYARILRYSGYDGPAVLDPGRTTSMGPADIDGQDVVAALQAVTDTENGEHYVDREGTIRFKSRSARYNAVKPALVFGERTDLGEWPYEDVRTDFDPTHLSNDAAITQQSTGQVFYAKDADSAAAFFPRTLRRTINSTSASECQDAANYLLSRYRQPVTRVSSLRLHPPAVPGMWAVCLALELGTRVRVMRRPPGAPVTQLDCFVERTQWDFGDDGEAWLTIQCSPADLTPYGVFTSWRSTLAAPVAAGTKSVRLAGPGSSTLYEHDFSTAGTWRIVDTAGNDVGAPIIDTDVIFKNQAVYAEEQTILEAQTDLPYDPSLTYRVSATVRTDIEPGTGGQVYIGLTGITATGERCNINGEDTMTSQYFAALRGVRPPFAQTGYTGYASGTATPGDPGPNPDIATPERLRPEIVAVRPLVVLMSDSFEIDGVQYLSSFTVHAVPAGGGIPARAQLGPGQKLVLGQGTPAAETVTVDTVGATEPGWESVAVTLTAATTTAHAAGDLVCEPLPSGTTDPTRWDAVARFNEAAFTY